MPDTINKLLAFQKEVKAIKKDQDNPFFKSKYADINGILAEVKPILSKHGLVVVQPLEIQDGKNTLKTEILDGEKVIISAEVILPEGLDAQKFGAAVTYYRRYALQSLLSLEAEDDDGNLATGKTVGKIVPKKSPREQFEGGDEF